MKHGLAAGVVAAVLGLASFAPLFLVNATGGINTVTAGALPMDKVTTGALPVEDKVTSSPGPVATVTTGAVPAVAPSAEPVATVTTDAELVAATPPEAQDMRGSAAFRDALAVLVDGDAVAAFELGGALDDAVERRTVQWAAIHYNAGTIDANSTLDFVADAPEFAAGNVFRTRVEQALTRARPAAAEVIETLGEATPSTIDAQIMLAEAHLAQGDSSEATRLARSIWIDNFLNEAQEARVIETFGELLDAEAHWARAMHLMMHDRARGSERLIPYLSPAQVSLVVARAAVSRDEADAKAKLDAVDASLQDNPVFIFSRAQRARQFDLWESAVDWLAKAPDEVPDADEWWYERRILVRKLLDIGQPALAYRAAADHDSGSDGRRVEAQFHAGWIALAFLDRAADAKAHFTAMAARATLPDSITQANYWLARANVALGDAAAARAAFETAARFPTVFYGQLARTELGETSVPVRPLPDWQPNQALFDSHAMVRAVRLLAGNGQADMAVPLLRSYASEREDGGDLLLAARLAEEIGEHHLAIAIAGMAEQRGAPLDAYSFPKDNFDTAELAADPAAVLAVTRQESMFQVDAVSSAGARGLMQLMPGTAKEVAKKVGVDYSPSRLVSDAGYNTLLGSTYLGTQLDRYDGSLVLAAAAYNAGPGNANKWIRAYGDPRASNVDPVIWVELIPFQETRTYVKRVLGNYLVYRQRLGDSPVTLQQALRTIE